MAELGAGSGSDYPTTLDTDNTQESSSTVARSNVPNDLAEAVVNTQTFVGVQGSISSTPLTTYLVQEHDNDGTHTTVTVSGTLTVTGAATFSGAATFNGNTIADINIRDKARNLVVGAVTDTTVDVDTDEIILQDTNGNSKRITSVNLTLDVTNQWSTSGSGADKNGLGRDDGDGTMDSSTWYNIWIVNGSSGTAGVVTTQSTLSNVLSNAVSTGGEYDTYGAYVGSIYSDSDGDFIPIEQRGHRVSLVTSQQIVNSGNPTTNLSDVGSLLDAAIPSTAKAFDGYCRVDSNGDADVTALLAEDGAGSPSGTGMKQISTSVTSSASITQVIIDVPIHMNISTAQTLTYRVTESTDRFSLWCNGWEY